MKRGYNITPPDDVIKLIAKGDQQQKLIEEYDDHELTVTGKSTGNSMFNRTGC